MDNSHIEDKLDEVQELFDKRPEEIETGLHVDGAEMLQLRKACRLLEAARHLKQENGYYTVVIEASFAAIERTIQFYLVDNNFLDPEEYVDHREVYERGSRAGLYSDEFKQKLIGLWRENRSRSYYREGVGSRKRADKMLELAEGVHSHVTQLAGKSHECICNTA
ncbi:MAG: hypothetical protein SV253_07105 [Halobacteria archaeon]|nr:hypothetical protein [Halobacteria archaeon]